MAVQPAATLKTYFEAGDTPTESQFGDLIDTVDAKLRMDGSNSPSANIDWASNKITGLGDATAATDALNRRTADQRVQDGSAVTGTAGGTANAVTLTLSPAPSAYVSGQTFRFVASAANTGAVTLDVNSLGAKNLYKVGPSGPTAMTGGEIRLGQVVQVTYDGTQFVSMAPVQSLVLLSSAEASTSSAISFTDLGATYGAYLIICRDVLPSTDGATLLLQFSTNNGSSWISTGYAWTASTLAAGGAGVNIGTSASDSAVSVTGGLAIGSLVVEGCDAQIWLSNLSGANRPKTAEFSARQFNTAGTLTYAHGAGTRAATTAAVNAVRLLMSSGNIESGSVYLYGLRKS